jgi:hypothetical protein
MPSTAKGSFTAELIDLIGHELTCRLIDIYGGDLLYIPQCHLDHPITDALGEHAARLLCERFGGSRLLIPLGQQFALETRNKAIRADRAARVPVATIAKRHHLSIRQVYNVLESPPAAPLHSAPKPMPQRQLSLF